MLSRPPFDLTFFGRYWSMGREGDGAIGMIGKNLLSRCFAGAILLAAADLAGIIAVEVTLTSPAAAQFRDDRFPFLS